MLSNFKKEAADLALSDHCSNVNYSNESQFSRDDEKVLLHDDTAALGDEQPVTDCSDVAIPPVRDAFFTRRCLSDDPGAYAVVEGTAIRQESFAKQGSLYSSRGLISVSTSSLGRGLCRHNNNTDHVSTPSLNVSTLPDASSGVEEEDSWTQSNRKVKCPTKKEHWSLKECHKSSRWCCALTTVMVVAGVVIAITVGVLLGAGRQATLQRNHSTNDGVNAKEPGPSDSLGNSTYHVVNTTETGPLDAFGNLILHCTNSSETLTNDMLQPFLHLNRTLYLQNVELISSDFDFPLNSCRPENLALLYLTIIEEKKDTNVFAWNDVTKSTYLLMTLFVTWYGMRWANNTGWQSLVSYCDWYGVGCNNRKEVVSEKWCHGDDPNSLRPSYQIANPSVGFSELFRLTDLKILSLTDNDLTGSLPTDLGTLTAFTALSFGHNKIRGAVPWSVMGNLQ